MFKFYLAMIDLLPSMRRRREFGMKLIGKRLNYLRRDSGCPKPCTVSNEIVALAHHYRIEMTEFGMGSIDDIKRLADSSKQRHDAAQRMKTSQKQSRTG